MSSKGIGDSGVFELQWDSDQCDRRRYAIYSHLASGQLRLESTYEQGPFDTALEVAQWAWRVMARLVPPAM
jgi:hypothetical protein